MMTRDDADVVIMPTPMSWHTDLLFGGMMAAVAVAGIVFDVLPFWLIVMSVIISSAWLALAVINAPSPGEGDNR